MPKMQSTESAQNILARLKREVELEVLTPTPKIKGQFHRAVAALEKARFLFDVLNDEKERESRK